MWSLGAISDSCLFVGHDDLEDSDEVVGPSGEEELSRGVPGEGGTLDFLLLFLSSGGVLWLGFVLVEGLVAWEIEDLDTGFGTNDEPVHLLGEENAVNWGVSLGLGDGRSLNEVPDHGDSVFTSRGKIFSIGWDVKGVNLSLVSVEGVHERHGVVVPDLDGSVPGSRYNDWGLGVVVELNGRYPVGVSVFLNGELALSNGVPDLESLVSTSRGDLSVVWRHVDGEDISGVADKSLGGLTLLQVPESESSVPGSREAVSSLSGKADFLDEVGVSLEDLSWLSPFLVLVGLVLLFNVPNHERLVSGSRDQELLCLSVNDVLSDLHGGNPSTVTLKVSSEIGRAHV